MKNKLIAVCILSFALINANAQRLGIKAGVSLAKGTYDYTEASLSTENLTGFHAGLIGEVPLSDNVFINSGALFSMKGTKLNVMGMSVDFSVNYVEIPLNLAYKYDLGAVKLFGQAGPYAGVGISAKMKSGGEEETFEFGSDSDQIKRIDYGVNFGAGVEIKKLIVGVGYGLGLANMSNDPDETFKNGVLSVSAGIWF
ncbi:MAG TPA: porin family protein [Bacteroidales bacterium]|jgi:hypothetical protein|nr:porin family protein [Bacteroidales bacterium]